MIEGILKPGSASSVLLSMRDGSSINRCVKSCLCPLGLSLGLGKEGEKEEDVRAASFLPSKTWYEAFSSLLSVTQIVTVQSWSNCSLSRHQPVHGLPAMVPLQFLFPWHCWWGCVMVPPLQKTAWQFLRTSDIAFPCDSAISLLGIDSREAKTYVQTKLLHKYS